MKKPVLRGFFYRKHCRMTKIRITAGKQHVLDNRPTVGPARKRRRYPHLAVKTTASVSSKPAVKAKVTAFRPKTGKDVKTAIPTRRKIADVDGTRIPSAKAATDAGEQPRKNFNPFAVDRSRCNTTPSIRLPSVIVDITRVTHSPSNTDPEV